MTLNSTLLSVIVPIYNCEKYVTACLESIAKQSVSEMEVICVDDGSTDGSRALAEEFAKTDERFCVIHQDNKGLSGARNTGLDVAKGRFIIFVDGDDIVGGKDGATGEEFNELISAMGEGEDIDFAFGDIDIVYEANRDWESSDRDYYKLPFTGLQTLKGTEALSMHCSVWSKCYRKSVIDRYQLRFPEGLNYEDAYWHMCFVAVGPRCMGLSTKVYTYYRRPCGIMNETFTSKSTQRAFQHVKIMEAAYRFYEKNNFVYKNIALLQKAFENCYHFAVHHSPQYDTLYVMWATGDILRKLDVDTSGSPLLESLKRGTIEIGSVDPSIVRHANKYRRYKAFLKKILPWVN